MIHTPIPGGWYTRNLLTGEFASLRANDILTDKGPIPQAVNEAGGQDGPLFLDITNVGGFRIAGKGSNSLFTREYSASDQVWRALPEAVGNYSVMYDLQGHLHISSGGDIGSQGWRYIAPDGTFVTGDNSILKDGISEFIDLGDDILLGQAHDGGGVAVRIDGVIHRFAEGECYDIRASRSGENVAFSYYEVAPDGLTAYVVWATLTELRALPVIEAPVVIPAPPKVAPPKINVLSYNAVLQGGNPWKTQFEDRGTTYTVTIDSDGLHIKAESPAGTDETGTHRPVVVLSMLPGLVLSIPEIPQAPEPLPVPKPAPEPVPEPPAPTPEPSRESRFWFAPNIGSKDLLSLTPSDLNHADVVQFYVQELLTDTSTPQLGLNVYPAVKDLIHALKDKQLGIEMGSVKPEDTDASRNTASLEAVFQRVEDAGGKVSFISMDEPLTGNDMAKVKQTIPQVADHVAKFILQAKSLRPNVKVGWIEAFPRNSFSEIESLAIELHSRGALPDYIHLDIEWNKTSDAAVDALLKSIKTLGLPYGVIVNTSVDPVATDAQHNQVVAQNAQRVHALAPDLPHVIVQSWAERVAGDISTQNVPANHGPDGLLANLEYTRALFSGTVPNPIPTPAPVPQESKVVKSQVSEDPIVVKQVKPIDGTKLFTLILPDGTVYSCQPDGSDDARPSGAQGDYEACRVSGNLATFRPDKKSTKFFTKTFVEVDEL